MSDILRVRNLARSDWPSVERLFGANGACGGCWCMHFRVPSGGKAWDDVKGEKNRAAMKRLVESGRQKGCLAFAGDDPVGWVSVGPRSEYLRMDNSRVFKTSHDEGAWSVACFFVRRDWQGLGVSKLLLRQAVALARESGAPHLLGYPILPSKGREARVPPVFAFTGFPQVFEGEGFADVTPAGASRPIYMKKLRAGGRGKAKG